jgi:hypothetical protein
VPGHDTAVPAGRSRLRIAATYEAGIWRSLYRWLTRRRSSSDLDPVLFGYAGQTTPLLLAFIFLSALEIPILPLLLPRPAVRDTLLAIGVWSLLWMLGLLASLRTNPHMLSEAGLRLRSGFQLDTCVPWQQITAIRPRRTTTQRKLQIDHGPTGSTLALQRANNLEVVFQHPVTVQLPNRHQATVDAIHFYADTPTQLLAAAHQHLTDNRQA